MSIRGKDDRADDDMTSPEPSPVRSAQRPFDRRRRGNSDASLTGPRMYERDELLGELQSVLSGTWHHPTGPIVIDGGPGTGKTAMFNACIGMAEQAGLMVLKARCDAAEMPAEYGVVLQLFSAVIRRLPVGDERVSAGAALAMRVLRHGPEDGDEPTAVFGGLIELIEHVAGGPALVIVDDAHAADHASASWLRFVARRVDPTVVHLVLTTRPRRAGVSLTATDRVLSESMTRRMNLFDLTAEGTAAMIADRLGSNLDNAVVADVHRLTGGNPRLVAAVLGSLLSTDVDSGSAAAALDRSVASIAHMTRTRVADFPDGTWELLEAVALLGASADLRVTAAIAGLDGELAGRIADRLADVSILQQGRPLEFVYPIVAGSVYADIPLSRCRSAHHHAVQLLLAMGRGSCQIAPHLLETEPGNDRWTTSVLVDAASELIGRGDVHLADRYLRRAAAEVTDEVLSARVAQQLAVVGVRLGREDAIEHLSRSLRLGLDVVEWVETALVVLDGQWTVQSALEVLAMIDEVVGDLGAHPHLMARVRLADMMIRGSRPDDSTRFDIGDEMAGADARRDSVDARLLEIQRTLWDGGLTGRQLIGALNELITGELIAYGGPTRTAVLVGAFEVLVDLGAVDVAEPLLRAARSAAGDHGHTIEGGAYSVILARLLCARGHVADAEHLLLQAIAIAVDDRVRSALSVCLTWVRVSGGDGWAAHVPSSVEVIATLEQLDTVPGLGFPLRTVVSHLAGELLLLAGDPAAALSVFADMARHPNGVGPLGSAGTWRATWCLALDGVGRHHEAAEQAAEHLGATRQVGVPVVIAGALAVVARTGSPSARIEMLEAAVRALDGVNAEPQLCAVLIDLGAACRRAGATARARDALRQAADIANRLGVVRLMRAAEHELLATGARPRRFLTSGVGALTPAELRTASLAAQGLTNNAIASSLFVSVKTVESHLARVFKKLEVSQRSELAAALEAATTTDAVRTIERHAG